MKFDIVRAWKEEAYRASLSTEQQATLPENPVGTLELSDAELEAVHGALDCMQTATSTFGREDLFVSPKKPGYPVYPDPLWTA